MDSVGKQLISTATALLLTLGVTSSSSLLLVKIQPRPSFPSFLIPFLGFLAVLSPFVQFSIGRMMAIGNRRQVNLDLCWS